jgi:hypothetical protein
MSAKTSVIIALARPRTCALHPQTQLRTDYADAPIGNPTASP